MAGSPPGRQQIQALKSKAFALSSAATLLDCHYSYSGELYQACEAEEAIGVQKYAANMGFRVIPGLTVTFASGKFRFEASLSRIFHPLDHFEARGELSPAVSACRFEITFSRLPLAYGTCRLRAKTSDSLLASSVVLDSPLQADALGPRLGPFLIREDRVSYENIAQGPVPDSGREPGLGKLYQLVSLIGEINSAQEVDLLLFKIIDAATQIMNAEAASLMLSAEESGDLVVAVPTGPARAEISGVHIPPGQGIAGWVAENGKPLAVPDVTRDNRFFGEISDHSFTTTDLVAVPLHTPEGKIIGVLEAINKNGEEPFSAQDIPLLGVLADHAALALEKERLTRAALERQLLEQELSLAAQIQQGFWPQSIPEFEPYQLAGMSLAARHVGGDYYDFILLDENRIAVVVADVSGKGVAASLVMATLRSSLRAHLKSGSSLEVCISEVNTTIAEDTPPNRFITLFIVILDRHSQELTFVNAGHNAPILLSADKQVARLEAGGPVLGFKAGLPYTTGEAEMFPGSLLLLFSDGVSEAQNPSEEFFEETRLLEAARKYRAGKAEQILTSLYHEVEEYTADATQYDDLTLVVVKLN